MSLHRLGREKEAQTALEDLRFRIRMPVWTEVAALKGLANEAEAVLAE
jgi:hypothetical protein